METIITKSSKETRKLGELLAGEITANQKRPSLFGSFRPRPACRCRRGREARPPIICLKGELGSGKTTFTQGFLKGLGIKGPHTSPTFLVIKNYKKEFPISKSQFLPPRLAGDPAKAVANKLQNLKSKIQNIYHIDAYRINAKDILNLGWEEIIGDNPPAGGNIIIIEWADRIKKIIPKGSLWIMFEWVSEKERKITLTSSRACSPR